MSSSWLVNPSLLETSGVKSQYSFSQVRKMEQKVLDTCYCLSTWTVLLSTLKLWSFSGLLSKVKQDGSLSVKHFNIHSSIHLFYQHTFIENQLYARHYKYWGQRNTERISFLAQFSRILYFSHSLLQRPSMNMCLGQNAIVRKQEERLNMCVDLFIRNLYQTELSSFLYGSFFQCF